MTQQETIDRDLRMVLGDMQVQLIFARAQIAELERQLGEAKQRLGEVLGAKQMPNGETHPFTERPIVEHPTAA